tara:strand:+ start:62 stop:553 length:492 start_codon:yes stop_codon:yes gene_type:complete
MADGDYYGNEADVFNIFGQESVERWSDADNNGVKDGTRIDWSLFMSKSIIDGRFREGPYIPPFGVRGTAADPTAGTVEAIMQYLSASIAGVILYDTRRVIDSESEDAVAQQRKNVDKMISQLLTGQLKLSQTRIGVAVPFNIPISSATTTLLVEPTWFNGFKL